MNYAPKKPVRSKRKVNKASYPNPIPNVVSSESQVISFVPKKGRTAKPQVDSEDDCLLEESSVESAAEAVTGSESGEQNADPSTRLRTGRCALDDGLTAEVPNPSNFPSLAEFKTVWERWVAGQNEPSEVAISAKAIWEQKQLERQLYPICPNCKHFGIDWCHLLGLPFDGSNLKTECDRFTAANTQEACSERQSDSSGSSLLPVEVLQPTDLSILSNDDLLEQVRTQHEAIAKIERMELELAFSKLERARAAGLYLQEFKLRCKHGEFERKLLAQGIKPRTAQDYMTIARHWELLESKARNSAFLESCQVFSINWALNTVREQKRLQSAAVANECKGAVSDTSTELSPASHSDNANTQVLHLDGQPPVSFSSICDEETARATSLGLMNGKQILPDLRDSDRAHREMSDPTTVDDRPRISHNVIQEPAVEEGNSPDNSFPHEEVMRVTSRPVIDDFSHWCVDTSRGVISNSDRFPNDQAAAIMKALLSTSFPQRAKQLLSILAESQIKSLMLLCDEELDARSSQA